MKKTIKLCLVGGGRAAKVHARSITRHLPGSEITALVETVNSVREETARMFAIEHSFPTIEQALDPVKHQNVDFDAVVITTPTFSHAELAIMAAHHGKHIFLEKPMAITLEECDQIMAAAEGNGVFLQLGFMRRFDPEFAAAYERIQAGEIGQPMLIKSLTHGPGLPPAWACDLSLSNGMLAEVNSHDWDCIRWLTGSNYTRVYAEVANFKGAARGVNDPDFYDNGLVTIRFQNGALGSISGICPCDYGYDARVEVVGEKGILQIGSLQGQDVVVVTDRDQGLVTPVYRTWAERFAWGYIYEMDHFVQCIKNGTSPKVGGEDGRWAVAGVLAATRSFQEGRAVNLEEVLC